MVPSDPEKPPLSKWSVSSLTAAIIGLLGFLEPLFAAVAVGGLIAGIIALRQIRTRGYGGRALALCGIASSLGILICVPILQVIEFTQEAPSSATRLDFFSPTMSDFENHEGRYVCLKGYAYPTDQQAGITSLLLEASGDRDSRPQVDEMVGVFLSPGTTWRYTRGPLAVSGRLTRNVTHHHDLEPLWILKDSSIRDARTPWQLDR